MNENGLMLQMAGVGSVVMTPLIGNLSDRYGRKALITLPLTLSVIPYGLYTLLYFSIFLFTLYIQILKNK